MLEWMHDEKCCIVEVTWKVQKTLDGALRL